MIVFGWFLTCIWMFLVISVGTEVMLELWLLHYLGAPASKASGTAPALRRRGPLGYRSRGQALRRRGPWSKSVSLDLSGGSKSTTGPPEQIPSHRHRGVARFHEVERLKSQDRMKSLKKRASSDVKSMREGHLEAPF